MIFLKKKKINRKIIEKKLFLFVQFLLKEKVDFENLVRNLFEKIYKVSMFLLYHTCYIQWLKFKKMRKDIFV